MSNYLVYILEASFVFAILYSVYHFLLRWTTFHSLNRMLLLAFIPLSFTVPALDVYINPVTLNELHIPKFEEMILVNQHKESLIYAAEHEFSFLHLLNIVYLIGTLFCVFKLVFSTLKLLNIKRKSQTIYDNGFIIMAAHVPCVFSFFNWIFVPVNKVNQCENPIIEHEKIHYELWHTLDLILTEFLVVLFWFNPFVFFFRKSIRSVHEYQVDSRILIRNVKKSHYLRLMLNNLDKHVNLIGLYSYLNCLTIKKRVKMMTKSKSHKFQLLKYFVFLPVIAILAMSFTDSFDGEPDIFPINEGEYMRITQNFGKTRHPITKNVRMHGGIDIKAKEGISVMATLDGTVLKASYEEGWGSLIIIDHGNEYETRYAHLKGFAIKKGEKVSKGQTIGYVGNTGNSTGSHLHYEVRLNNENVDPMGYIKQ